VASVRPDRIDQVVPSFGKRDAIGVHILYLRDLLRDLGFRSDIWCVGAFEDVRSECRLLDELPPRAVPGTWWLYHLSNGSPAAQTMLERPEPLLLDYHNITPGELFAQWVDWAAQSAQEARTQLVELGRRATFMFADSAFNESELKVAGFCDTCVVPPLFDPSAHASDPDRALLASLKAEKSAGGADWLFVGRVAPSKAQHDLVKAFACFREHYDRSARLHLVGTWLGHEYPDAVMRFADRLGLGTSVKLPGAVSEEELVAYYEAADVFVSASDHEGFCIPIIEAMYFGVPVVSYGAGAVPETSGGAAIVLEDKSAVTLATSVARVLGDDALRSRMVRAGRRRAGMFSLSRTRDRWAAAIESAIAAGSARELTVR
jgi:glycosyltransferase involved in cell wall biosynthesis